MQTLYKYAAVKQLLVLNIFQQLVKLFIGQNDVYRDIKVFSTRFSFGRSTINCTVLEIQRTQLVTPTLAFRNNRTI